ncbi:aminotransferase class I/II-fold pyridoxal phosphate-dependent enzyme [Candidatus Peregrinibacteria bacterium]|nr:aminotransferase class I/II-fold pyridoxal phosphate-dependent enzyme [Candidatus Peregrinibacteria bacterium]
MKPSIFTSLSPNIERDDFVMALKLFLTPWRWKHGKHAELLEKAFADFFQVQTAVSFNSGRSSLLALLKIFDVQKNDEILLQAFTCSAVPAPIIWAGAKPVFVDVDPSTFTLSVHDLEKKITQRSKGIIAQHTFGISADMERILIIAKKHGLFVIEDCAHAIGNVYAGNGNERDGKKLGTLGDAGFFSFGRDKVISSVYGGMAITNNPALGEKLRMVQSEYEFPRLFWIGQQLWHPLILRILIPLYYFLNIGKILLVLFQKLGLLSLAISKEERSARKPSFFPKKFPNALAALAFHQFKKLEKFQQHRIFLAEFYNKALKSYRMRLPQNVAGTIFLRYPLATPRAQEILHKAKEAHIVLGDWYTSVLAPEKIDIQLYGYKNGCCPVAQRLSEETFNLPTHIHISERDAKHIVQFLEKYLSNIQ